MNDRLVYGWNEIKCRPGCLTHRAGKLPEDKMEKKRGTENTTRFIKNSLHAMWNKWRRGEVTTYRKDSPPGKLPI